MVETRDLDHLVDLHRLNDLRIRLARRAKDKPRCQKALDIRARLTSAIRRMLADAEIIRS